MTLFEQIIATFGGTQVNIHDLPADDPDARPRRSTTARAATPILTELLVLSGHKGLV